MEYDITTVEGFQETVKKCYSLIMEIENLPLDQMMQAYKTSESLGPILDPTSFIKKGQAMSEDKQIVSLLYDIKLKFKHIKRKSGFE